MPTLFSRTVLRGRIEATFADPAAIGAALGEVTLPKPVQTWLSRLKLLSGVPVHYLVPDEAMLPPESIRFFYLDTNWVDALVDGAFSIGRNLTQAAGEGRASKLNVDRAVSAAVHGQAAAGMGAVRANAFGVAPPPVRLEVVSGFMLRSSVVIACPGMGVNAYDAAGEKLTVLRFERLGPAADTVICLVDGDMARADIHEPPEGLHYGIDSYKPGPPVAANKEIHTFSTDGAGNVTLNPEAQGEPIGGYFRTVAPRTLRMQALGSFLASLSPPLQALDSAQMGFEMSQGVGLVSFVKRAG